jgi:hypothetical protein
MDRVERGRTQQIRCANCGQITPGYNIVNYGSIEKGHQQICSRCLNTEVAKSDGLENFEHLRFDPVELADCTGKAHFFHFRTHLFGPGIALDAFEVRNGNPGGYQFQLIGEPEDDLLALLGRLIDKIRRALSKVHIGDGEFGLRITDNRVVRGMIGWDEAQDGRVPLLSIDGREITWDELGHILMSYEGWHFKLEIRDKSEEFLTGH